MKMVQTVHSETLAFKLQTPRKNPEKNMTFKMRQKFEIKYGKVTNLSRVHPILTISALTKI
jgi:hypothetical protein